MSNTPKILAYNGWDPLEEVWLGDVWPKSFYDDLEPSIRDSFYTITDWTKEDLNIIQAKLEEFGITVRRPIIDESKKDQYINKQNGKLFKPPICPRDYYVVIGDKLYYRNHLLNKPWTDVINQTYSPDNLYNLSKEFVILNGAGTVRYGKDIIFDQGVEGVPGINAGISDVKNETLNRYKKFLDSTLKIFGDDYRCHFITNGGHTDGCFATLKPGLLMTTKYFSDYDLFFPGWEKIYLSEPTYAGNAGKIGNFNNAKPGKWNLGGPGLHSNFNDYIEKFCIDWVGDFTETYFEVNTLMLDEKNMLCMGTHDRLFKKLEQHGITCHVVPFRTRTFWDGGIHCITLDIRRKAVLQDYFPERGPAGAGYKVTQLGDQLDAEYEKIKNLI
jgi:hypothetical protein